MAEKYQQTKPMSVPNLSRFLWPGVVLGGALLLILGGMLLARPNNNDAPNFKPEVTGAPRLAVDQTTIDEGDIKVDTQIRTAYRLQNVGDRPLQILGEPAVELVEGC